LENAVSIYLEEMLRVNHQPIRCRLGECQYNIP